MKTSDFKNPYAMNMATVLTNLCESEIKADQTIATMREECNEVKLENIL